MNDPKLALMAMRDAQQEAMFDAMDMEDEILKARGWDGKDDRDRLRLARLVPEVEIDRTYGDEDDLPF